METVVAMTVTVDVVAVDRKQLQALLMRESIDEHKETILSAGLAAERRVGARFW